jgi:hypothetical protein
MLQLRRRVLAVLLVGIVLLRFIGLYPRLIRLAFLVLLGVTVSFVVGPLGGPLLLAFGLGILLVALFP